MVIADYWPLGVVAATTAVGYGELRARVTNIRRDVDGKASREVVDAHYSEIIRRLDRIENRVNREEA